MLDKKTIAKAFETHYNPLGSTEAEFHEDLNRIRYVKILLKRYMNKKELRERLILNHLIIFSNVFGSMSIELIKEGIENEYDEYLKPFLSYINIINKNDSRFENVPENVYIVNRLKEL